MIVRHTTSAGAEILEKGFLDSTGSYMMVNTTLTGVWVGDHIHSINDGIHGDDVLEIVIDEVHVSPFEVRDLSGKQDFREWCVPASVLNDYGEVRLLSDDEVDEVMTKDLEPIDPLDARLVIDPATLARVRSSSRRADDRDAEGEVETFKSGVLRRFNN